MASQFSGESSHKVDSKGRVAVPAVFRRALEFGDPDRKPDERPVVHVVYGSSQTCHVECYSEKSMQGIIRRIKKMEPGSFERRWLDWFYNTRKYDAQLDDTGRLLLNAQVRKKLGTGNEVMFVGSGDSFEIWKLEDYEQETLKHENFMKGLVEQYGENFHPLQLLDDRTSGRNGSRTRKRTKKKKRDE